MKEAASTKTEPFSDFTRQPYSFISDDFCHEKFLVVKPTIKANRAILKLKETVTHKGDNYHLSDEVKLWIGLPQNGSIYAKLRGNDYVKIHYDNGYTTFQNKLFNFYAACNSDRTLALKSVKLGVAHDSKHCHSDNRLKISQEKGGFNYTWGNRTMVYDGKFRFGLVTCFDICNKILKKNNVLFGYDVNLDTQVFLRAETEGFRDHNPNWKHPEGIFDKVTLDVISVLKRSLIDEVTTGGIEVKYLFILGWL